MSKQSVTEEKRRSRLRWVTLGEAIAVAALVISGLGLWHEWNSGGPEKEPAAVVQGEKPIPLVLRGRVNDEGRTLQLSPIEERHALDSLTLTIPSVKESIPVGSNGELRAGDVEDALGNAAKDGKGTHRLPVRIAARYVEQGADREATRPYVLTYEWRGGGLFGGRSLRITGLSRS